MKLHFTIAFFCLLASAAWAQQAQQDLPSAPSAVVFPKKQQAPPPPPPAAPPPATAPASQPAPAQAVAQPAPATSATETPAAQPASPAARNESPEPPASDDQPIETIRKRVNEVNVIFTVTDKHGHFVKDLKKDDFKVLDDNKPPQSVVSFRAETDLPLRVGLLVDTSNSIRDRFRFEQESAIEFLNQVVRPKSDRAFVIGFDTTAEIYQDFTDSTEKLAHGIRQMRPGGGTAMFDAVYWACRDKLMKDQTTGPVRRALILLSDGDDNQSRVTREEAIEMAERAEVIIYAISTNSNGYRERGDKVLERMAEATGGQFFSPFKASDVANAFSAIQDELRSQYALSYRPSDFVADGRFRPIDIEADKKNLKVRARKGYYAPTQ
ncbi:MAG TPA: VWA domain-containing protein [Terriglobales bacterium]|nr:VWA domain-containing protein [Terriglobales bacterium]